MKAKPKKTPMRMCVVCKRMHPKKELLRIVKNDDGVSLDFTGKKAGRGAYICKSVDCIDKCVSKKMLSRVFSMPIDDEVYSKIKTEYDENIKN